MYIAPLSKKVILQYFQTKVNENMFKRNRQLQIEQILQIPKSWAF